jgi:hypothetical protein
MWAIAGESMPTGQGTIGSKSPAMKGLTTFRRSQIATLGGRSAAKNARLCRVIRFIRSRSRAKADKATVLARVFRERRRAFHSTIGLSRGSFSYRQDPE